MRKGDLVVKQWGTKKNGKRLVALTWHRLSGGPVSPTAVNTAVPTSRTTHTQHTGHGSYGTNAILFLTDYLLTPLREAQARVLSVELLHST